MSMCNGQLLSFFILICGHIKKISHHYCVNIWTHIEKKVLTLELSSESTLIEPLKHKHWTKCHRKIFPFSFSFFTYTLLLFYYLKIQWILATIAYANRLLRQYSFCTLVFLRVNK